MTDTVTAPLEKVIDVADGRTLAYDDSGDPTSSLVIIFLPGTLSVGVANRDRESPILAAKNAHFIAVTIPGYGNTSPPAKGKSYAHTIATDMAALLNHTHPNAQDLQLHIGGGSFGTIPAQMLYGASFELFPQGRFLKGLLLMGTFPPLETKQSFNWEKHLSWPNWVSVGPPARILPFRIVQRLMSTVIASKLKTQESAEAFLRELLIDKMNDEEKKMYQEWREKHGYDENRLIREMAEMNLRSVANSWEGLMSSSDVLYSQWWDGKKVEDLDDQHTQNRFVVVVAGEGDDATSPAWAEFTTSVYKNARMKLIRGGHISAIFQMDEIWEEYFLGL